MRIFNDSFKLSNSCAVIHDAGTFPYKYKAGVVKTPDGIVEVYAQNGDGQKDKLTRLDFVWNGRLHMRTIYQTFSKRGLSIVAGRFAREIANFK